MIPDTALDQFIGEIRFPSRIGFYLDENISQDIVAPLREVGIPVRRVEEDAAKSELDYLLLSRSRVLGYVFVTHDRDFDDLHEQIIRNWGTRRTSHAGIILIKPKRRIGYIVSTLSKMGSDWYPEWFRNVRWTL